MYQISSNSEMVPSGPGWYDMEWPISDIDTSFSCFYVNYCQASQNYYSIDLIWVEDVSRMQFSYTEKAYVRVRSKGVLPPALPWNAAVNRPGESLPRLTTTPKFKLELEHYIHPVLLGNPTILKKKEI